jgi:hypothetical protein
MALLLTSVFGVTGCGSDDDVQVESRVKNAAPEASGVSDAPSKAGCNLSDLGVLDLLDLRDFDLMDRGLPDTGDRFLGDLLDYLDDLDDALGDFRDYLDYLDLDDFDDRDDLRDRLDQCAAASDSGADSVTTTTTTTTVPAGDDDLAASTSVCVDDGEGVKRPFEAAVEQFREDLALFRVVQNGRNDQSLTEEQRQGYRANYSSAYDVKTKSAAAAIQVANERGFNLDSPDNLDESFLRKWDSTICE